jgi:hypothetical protein
MYYLDKGEMLINRDVNKFVHNILEKYAFCAYGTFRDFHVAFVFLFSKYIYTIMTANSYTKPTSLSPHSQHTLNEQKYVDTRRKSHSKIMGVNVELVHHLLL